MTLKFPKGHPAHVPDPYADWLRANRWNKQQAREAYFRGIAHPQGYWTWPVRDWIDNYVKDNPIQWTNWEKPEGWDDRPVYNPNVIYQLTRPMASINWRPAEEPLFQRDKAWDADFNEAFRGFRPLRPLRDWGKFQPFLGRPPSSPREPGSYTIPGLWDHWDEKWGKNFEDNPNFGTDRYGGWLPRHESNPVHRPTWHGQPNRPLPGTGDVTGTDTDTDDATFGDVTGDETTTNLGGVTGDPIGNNENIIRNSINKPRVTSQTFG